MPFQKSNDISKAINILLKDDKVDSVVIVSEAKQHPMKALKIIGKNKNKRLVGYFDNKGESATGLPRQKFDKAYFRSNVIVLGIFCFFIRLSFFALEYMLADFNRDGS